MTAVEEQVPAGASSTLPRRRRRARGDVDTYGPAVVRTVQVVLILVLLGAWQIAATSGFATPGTLPSPVDVARELGTLVGTGDYWTSVLDTIETWAAGLLIAAVIAIPVGAFLGANSFPFRATRATLDFVRTLPPVALIPVVSLLYGAKPETALILVVFATVWPLMVQTMYGIRQVDAVARDTARVYQLGRWRKIWSVWLPSALPFIGTGVRIASTISLLLAVGVELIAGPPGLGASIAVAEQTYENTQMYAYIVTTAVLGVLITTAMIAAERRVLGWHPSYRKAS